MGIVDTAAKAATAAIDQFSNTLFSGKLAKAEFNVFKKPDLSGTSKKVSFFINPNSLSIEKEVVLSKEEMNQATPSTTFAYTNPVCFKIGEMWFDTYDERVSVREKYIDDLESLLDFEPSTHYIPVVVFNWGKFTGESKHKTRYKFYVTKLSVEYTMFLPDATPVRAKASISMEQALTIEEARSVLSKKKESPDHAKLYTVKRGDTLQGIAAAEYHDPREWRRIASTNNINTPMDLRPGMKLLVPPIL